MPCYCTLCYPSSTFTRSTVQKHLNKDLQKRAQQQPRTDSALRAFVDGCISRNQAYLATGKTQNVPGENMEASVPRPVVEEDNLFQPNANKYSNFDVEMDELDQANLRSSLQVPDFTTDINIHVSDNAGLEKEDSDSDDSVDNISANW
ncbi:hypothetical protein CPB83DRAFT_932940 [Crepidotus variabilis]|uniref:Uncharacterized protein n=1 Tax=Crepidotus variabilis TaxID=179855 RepID=A0A9P6E2M2_9AGAR|nr:hypothetical protein CPB83DRAFT_932940 [Crepidotus variabilis]